MKFRKTLLLLTLASGFIVSNSFEIPNAAAEGRQETGRRGRPNRIDNAPKVGDTAPLFTLKSQDGKSKTSLVTFKDKKPVVLFFGSYT